MCRAALRLLFALKVSAHPWIFLLTPTDEGFDQSAHGGDVRERLCAEPEDQRGIAMSRKQVVGIGGDDLAQ